MSSAATEVIPTVICPECELIGEQKGTLETKQGEYAITFFTDTKELSQHTFELLQQINQQNETFSEEILQSFTFPFLSEAETQVLKEIEKFLAQLNEMPKAETKGQELDQKAQGLQRQAAKESAKEAESLDQPKEKETRHPSQLLFGRNERGRETEAPVKQKSETRYASLFALASATRKEKEVKPPEETRGERQEPIKNREQGVVEQQAHTEAKEEMRQEERRIEKDKEEGEGQQQQQQEEEETPQEKQQKKEIAKKIERKAARAGAVEAQDEPKPDPITSVENLFNRFMALMARILGQAEAEAHELYLRIKERTDDIDLLTLLISKINSEPHGINWKNNPEMRQLVDRARALGVDIPAGKYEWSVDEKKILKENIQMRKDSMEKITQLERTDMQRFLQEASQCHQMRSNILKLLKEVVDTIVHNMRPN
jgi:hypothetical protein